jgi:hypothetical protein
MGEMVDFNLNVVGGIELNNENIPLHGSPTTTLRQHVIRALYDGTLLSKIDKIRLVGTDGYEYDYTSSLSYSVSGNQLTITCSITVTASYTIAKVRAYAGTNLYFETALSTTQSVREGDVVNITLTITVSISGTLTYGGSTYSMTMVDFGNLVCNVLAGSETPDRLKISSITFVGTAGSINVGTSNTLSADGLSVSFTGSGSAPVNNTITEIDVLAPTRTLWKYTGLSVSVTAGSTLSYSETVSA